MKGKLITLTFMIWFFSSNTISASEQNDISVESSDSKVNVKINNQINSSNQSSTNIKNNLKVEVKNNTFTISGPLDSFTDTSLVVAGQQIQIDKTKVNQFSQSGHLQVGAQIEVKGIIENSILYASEVRVKSGGSTSSVDSSASPSPSKDPSSSSDQSSTSSITLIIQTIISFIKNLFV